MKAVVLFSGGIDSTVILAIALSSGRECYALSFDYNQRHRCELESAKELAKYYNVPHTIAKLEIPAFNSSALLTNEMVPQGRLKKEISTGGIPSTYVPARNSLFLALAMGQAEVLNAQEIYIGCNTLDYAPYVDCRPLFIDTFQSLINVSTKQAIEGNPPRLLAPLIQLDKQAIICKGIELKVPLHLTWSCYSPSSSGKPCQLCDACRLRSEGFKRIELRNN